MRCADCGVERTSLHKHHIIPRSQGGPDTPDNLVGLCSNCHEDRHGGSLGGSLRGLHSQTEEARAKRSATMKAHWEDPEFRARGEAALRSPEKRAAGSKAQKALWADPEYRAKVIEQMNRPEARKATVDGYRRWLEAHPEVREEWAARLGDYARSPEHSRRTSETNKRLGRRPPPPMAESTAHARTFLGTPEAKANHRAALVRLNADPEFKARKSAKSKEMWADPDYRAKMNEKWGRGGETCGRGHPFSGDNLYIDGRSRRVCRTCKAEASRRSRAKANPTAKARGPYRNRGASRCSRRSPWPSSSGMN
jgi:hypothetical protein